ncbi:kinase-like domain-containing protein [Abortiporus biennis]|nr:kinase-like domain-containing protein [Abortiporus biennis]
MRRRSAADSDDDSLLSACSSSSSSTDEDDINCRMAPNWCAYRQLIEKRGFRLDTCRDVKQWYQHYWEMMSSQGQHVSRDLPGYTRACSIDDENDLCKDAGLPENLFRGSRSLDGKKVVIKAVHLRSHEYHVVKYMSHPQLRRDPRNHLIPIFDLIEVPIDQIAFIVMEEWSPQLITETPCTLRLFLGCLRQCIEHVVFMHSHNIAHLDISIRNLLTDYNSHYSYIDFELSRRFDKHPNPRISTRRGTELPPELERGESTDPYKVDIWALAMLIIRACSMSGYNIPELSPLLKAMLNESFERRPPAYYVLNTFDSIAQGISEGRLQRSPPKP